MRHQLPVYSPVTWRGVARAKLAALRVLPDPRPPLARHLAAAFSAQRVVLYGSGSQALRDAIAVALRRSHTRVVALPAFSCYDVAAAAVAADARIALYDLDPVTLSPDAASFSAVLSRGVRVAVVAPLYGFPVDWEALAAVAASHGAVLIEDAAQGQGAEWRGKALGSLGQLSVLSFGRGKGWTGGSGGALLLRGEWAEDGVTPPPASFAADARVVAQLVAQWWLGRPAVYGIPSAIPWLALGETVYHDVPEPRGMSRAAAAAVLAHTAESTRAVAIRRAHAAALTEQLRSAPQAALARPVAGSAPGYLRLPLRRPGGIRGLGDPSLAGRLGIAASYPRTLGELSQVGSRLEPETAHWPGGEELARTLLTLPTHEWLTPGEMESISSMLSH